MGVHYLLSNQPFGKLADVALDSANGWIEETAVNQDSHA
jgi:hypothetical protein